MLSQASGGEVCLQKAVDDDRIAEMLVSSRVSPRRGALCAIAGPQEEATGALDSRITPRRLFLFLCLDGTSMHLYAPGTSRAGRTSMAVRISVLL